MPKMPNVTMRTKWLPCTDIDFLSTRSVNRLQYCRYFTVNFENNFLLKYLFMLFSRKFKIM